MYIYIVIIISTTTICKILQIVSQVPSDSEEEWKVIIILIIARLRVYIYNNNYM